jgi:hypothetical protein
MDVSLEISLNRGNINVESNEISVELVDGVFKESMVNSLELGNKLVEGSDDTFNVLELMLS